MDSTFALFKLPKNAMMTALEYCGVPELIILSTLSKRAKHLVKSDKRKACNVEILVGMGCIVNLNNYNTTITFGESQEKDSDMESLTSCTLRVVEESLPAVSSFTVPGFGGVRNWLKHFMFIFNHPMTSVSFGLRHQWKFSMESVKKVLKGIPIGHLAVFENACEIIRNFPIMNLLLMDKLDLEPELSEADTNFMKKVLMGNINCININRAMRIDLNTLLMLNCPDITFYRPLITERELNTFVKLWLKGANPNLRRLLIEFSEHWRSGLELNPSAIMKGIKCEGPNDGNQFFFTIRKRDGTQANIMISSSNFYLNVRQ